MQVVGLFWLRPTAVRSGAAAEPCLPSMLPQSPGCGQVISHLHHHAHHPPRDPRGWQESGER